MKAPLWCSVHHAPFRDGVTRWCKKSQPRDTCEVDKASLPPRQPSGPALLLLGHHASEPGFLQFVREAQAQGFGLDQPGDNDMDEDRWAEVSFTRARVLVASYQRFVDGLSGRHSA